MTQRADPGVIARVGSPVPPTGSMPQDVMAPAEWGESVNGCAVTLPPRCGVVEVTP